MQWQGNRRWRLTARFLGILTLAPTLTWAGNVPAPDMTVEQGRPNENSTEAYLAQLADAHPESEFRRQLRRQRSYATLARGLHLIAEGKNDEAAKEFQTYLTSNPGDVFIRFRFLVLATDLKRHDAAVAAADRILTIVPAFSPALFYRGLAEAALGQKRALQDLSAASKGGNLTPRDLEHARKSLADVALDVGGPEGLKVLDDQITLARGDPSLIIARGQILERLGRLAEAADAYADAAAHAEDTDLKHRAFMFGVYLALKRDDPDGALSLAQKAWALAPGDVETGAVLADTASRLGRADLIETVLGQLPAGMQRRKIQETLANTLFKAGQFEHAATEFGTLAETAEQPAEEYRLRRAAGFAAQSAHDNARAFSEFSRAAEIAPTEEAFAAAADASLQAGRFDEAVSYLDRLAALEAPSARPDILKKMSTIDEQRRRFRDAIAALYHIPPEARDAGVERRLGILSQKTQDLDAAVAHFRRLSQLEPSPENLRLLADAELAARHPEAAAESFARAAKMSTKSAPSFLESQGNALMSIGHALDAAVAYRAAYEMAPRPDLALSIGNAYQSAGLRALAVTFLQRALAEPQLLSPSQLKAAEAALGYAYADEKRYDLAATAFQKALAIAPDNIISLSLARMYRLSGEPKRATEILEQANADLWPSVALEAEYHEERAEAMAAQDRWAEARNELDKAVAIAPTAQRHFRLSQIASRLGDRDAALHELESALASEPDNASYRAALGYALRESRPEEAASLLEEVLAAEPGRQSVREDLGYLYLGLNRNREAVAQFERIIDDHDINPANSSVDDEAIDRKIYGLRSTVDTVEPHWTTLAYTNLCLTGRHCSSREPNLGSLISRNQGGIEIAYQPPDIGYVDGRVFRVFGRTFFEYYPGRISPRSRSFQGGVGVEYKPFRDYNLVISGERLIKLGADAENNWLTRISFSTNAGFDMDPVASSWQYNLLYIDLAGTVKHRHRYLAYGEAREGISFRLTDEIAGAPFVYGIFRGNYGAGRDVSAEVGLGLSLRGFFDKDKYHAPRGSVEFLPRMGYTFHDTRARNGVLVSISIVAGF